jgi:Fungal N-terminal domain of STAND proteins
MEAVASGSAVLTFIGLALTSIKSLHQAASAYREVSERTKSIASALSGLESILTQLKSCKAFLDQKADVHHIENLVKRCREDLLKWDKVIKRVQPDPKSRKVKQFLRKATAFLSEKELGQIWTEINQQCTILGVQLQFLQS